MLIFVNNAAAMIRKVNIGNMPGIFISLASINTKAISSLSFIESPGTGISFVIIMFHEILPFLFSILI